MSDSENILELRGVHIPGLTDIHLELHRGERVAIQIPHGLRLADWADLASGLIEPEAGCVCFRGQDWASLNADRAAAARGRIGRVFAQGGWISNLDIDENILLARRHHGRLRSEDLRAEAQELADALGLGELPSRRPAWAHAPRLQLAQWVRALLNARELLLLEEPLHHLNREEAGRVGALLDDETLRSRCGLLWISTEPPSANPDSPHFDRIYTLKDERLESA